MFQGQDELTIDRRLAAEVAWRGVNKAVDSWLAENGRPVDDSGWSTEARSRGLLSFVDDPDVGEEARALLRQYDDLQQRLEACWYGAPCTWGSVANALVAARETVEAILDSPPNVRGTSP